MTELPKSTPDPIRIVYDGECPFCSAYVRMVRLREAAGEVELIDARSTHPLVQEIKAQGLDLNEGMVVEVAGERLHGDAAMTALAAMTTRSGAFNRLVRAGFSNPVIARRLYPVLVTGRNATLRLLGRRRIDDTASSDTP